MYSNIIGRTVWDKCQNESIWRDDYDARIEVEDNSLFDRIDIRYDSLLEPGEIKGVWIVRYVEVAGGLGEDTTYLAGMPMDEQKKIFDIFEKEIEKRLGIKK